MFSVASRTIRKAFWLVSLGVQAWDANALSIFSFVPLNVVLQRSQITSSGSRLTTRIFRERMSTVYSQAPVQMKWHQYQVPLKLRPFAAYCLQ